MDGLNVEREEIHVGNGFKETKKKKPRFRNKGSKKNNHPSSGQEALKHSVHCSGNPADVKRFYVWGLLKKKEIIYYEARVVGLGPRFMSVYIPKLAMERQIHYHEVEGLRVEWLDATSTLLLSQSMHDPKSGGPQGKLRPLDETALIVSPTNDPKLEMYSSSSSSIIEPPFFPLTLHRSSTITVALHAAAVGGRGTPNIVARLCVSSYFDH